MPLWWTRLTQPPWSQPLLAGLGGAGLALGQAPFDLLAAGLVGLGLAFWALSQVRTGKAGAWVGWVFGTVYFAITLNWITEPFQVDAAATGWMAPFALGLLAGGLALFWGFAGWIAGRFANRVPAPLSFALALCAVELARAFVFTGFPWAMIAGIWLDTPLAIWLAWIGPHGLGLLTLILAAGFFLQGTLAKLTAGLGTLAALCAGVIFASAPALIAPDAPLVRLVQPNAPQHQKWDPDWVNVFFRRQLEATSQPGAPDLTVWPETAVAYALPYGERALAEISDAANGRAVVFGINSLKDDKRYNSVVALDDQGQIQAQYDKSHLVPFGEYIPFADQMRQFGLRGLADTLGGGFAPGPGPALLELGPLGRALPLLCYEAVFPNFGRALSQDARVMLHLTNDAWFGSFAGPQQHLAIARMRAIERGVPVIRVANTGVSAMIDADGEILGQIPLNESGFLDHALPPRRAPTPYVKLGEIPFFVLWLLCASGALIVATRRKD